MANKDRGSKNTLKPKQDKAPGRKVPRYEREAAAAAAAKVANIGSRP